MNHLIQAYRSQNIVISSIGLDGEEMDQITFLPKPRIRVFPGMLVVTAFDCLAQATAGYSLIKELSIDSPLGKMQVIAITKEGLILVGGPSKIQDVISMIAFFDYQPIDKIFVDGAFSRHSSIKVADGFIYCVGGGYSTILSNVIHKAMMDISRLDITQTYIDDLLKTLPKTICLIERGGEIIKLPVSSLLTEFDVLSQINELTEAIYLPNALTDEFAKKLLRAHPISLKTIIVEHPTSIQVKDDTFKRLHAMMDFHTLHHTPLLAVCMNPTSPYRNAYDRDEMKQQLQDLISYPVIDVLEEGENIE